MTTGQQWGVVAGVVALLALGLWTATRVLGDELFPVTIGSQAPAFRATVIDSEAPRERELAEYRGQVVLLNVWATWCPPCREEMPSIQALHESFDDSGLAVVAVSVDEPGSGQAIREFAREYGLTFDILHDTGDSLRALYQTTGVPETFLIDGNGRIVRKHIGHADWNSAANRALVAGLLGVADPESAAGAGAAPPADSARATTVPALPSTSVP